MHANLTNIAICNFSLSQYASYWWSFPSNRYNWINKTKIPNNFVLRDQADLINLQSAVEGVIDRLTYNGMLRNKFLGNKIFEDFQGYNSPKDCYFINWNSPAVTDSAVMLALVNYRHYFL